MTLAESKVPNWVRCTAGGASIIPPGAYSFFTVHRGLSRKISIKKFQRHLFVKVQEAPLPLPLCTFCTFWFLRAHAH